MSATQGHAEHAHRAVTTLWPAWWRCHRQQAGALGVVGPMPRATMLHGECAERPKDDWN
jgi:hypothetical protein